MVNDFLSARKLAYLEALLTSRTKKEAAEKAGITARQARNYMRDPEVRAALADLQDAVLDETADRCAALALEALDIIAGIMRDESNTAGSRLMAARLVLESSARLTDQLTITERIAALEAKLDEKPDDEATRDPGGAAGEPAGDPWRQTGRQPSY